MTVAGTSTGGSAIPFPMSVMEAKPFALDRLALEFRWGNYGFRVLRCHLVRFPPGHIVEFHKHSEFEFHFIPAGKGTVIMGDRSHDLRPGMFYLTGPNVLHCQIADEREAMYELCLHIDIVPLSEETVFSSDDGKATVCSDGDAEGDADGDGKADPSVSAARHDATAAGTVHAAEQGRASDRAVLAARRKATDHAHAPDAVGTDVGPVRSAWGRDWEIREAEECVRLLSSLPLVPAEDRYHAMHCFAEAYRAWEDNSPGFFTTYRNAVIQILLRAIRAYMPEQHAPPAPQRDMHRHRYELAVQFIEDNCTGPITLESVAEKLGISPRQLQRIMKTCGSLTFREHVEAVRLKRICEQLKSSRDPVDVIAGRNGYGNSSYFYTVFKKTFGMTPKQYREHTQT